MDGQAFGEVGDLHIIALVLSCLPLIACKLLPSNSRMLTVTDLVGAARVAIQVYQLGWGAENDASE
jgi:hypothetical protein